MGNRIFVGAHALTSAEVEVDGGLVDLEDGQFYKINNYDRMRPFFMTVVSGSDHWMFLSSRGGLSAGRKNPEHALFPYVTDDKIHDSAEITGSKTIILAEREGRTCLWEPFSDRHEGLYDIRRNLYKSCLGNRIRFEEENRDLGLTFSYDWTNSDSFGLVKQSRLLNRNGSPTSLRVLDGVQNLLPYGVSRDMQAQFSTLLDAYKKNELLPETGLGLFLLSSIPVDRPEPSEALTATTVWAAGISRPVHLLSTLQLDAFRRGRPIVEEVDIRAERGAFFVESECVLEPGAGKTWYLVAEINQTPSDIAALVTMLSDEAEALATLQNDLDRSSRDLLEIVSKADGLQQTGDALTCARHFSNVLFNVMRGGVFVSNYVLNRDDLVSYLEHHNRTVFDRHGPLLDALPPEVTVSELRERAAASNDVDLQRLCLEYLPLTFSRRHGDPSRPWNEFSIETRKDDGSQNLDYQGNWRDIFQNWEALGLSFPEFLEGMVCKFVNASTPDGYNPYRLSRDGIDWEIVDPNDAWSFIGYWGDHQIIYLLKLLEVLHDHDPHVLHRLFETRMFVYANVPYRIGDYEALVRDPHNTISYNLAEEELIAERVATIGADGKLVLGDEQRFHHVTLAEKLLVPALSKLSNFVPEAGIWMNTQRPEWNDANNALVGYGVSVVTLCYLRRYVDFLLPLASTSAGMEVSEEVAEHLAQMLETLERWQGKLVGSLSDSERRNILDELGRSGARYRSQIYDLGFSGRRSTIPHEDVCRFLELTLQFADHTIRSNRRSDGLYHAYNLIDLDDERELPIGRLYEMLEGQVAALSSGCLSLTESLGVLEALRQSALYRKDQNSYLLYPDRRLPRFTEKNLIPEHSVSQSALLSRLLEEGDRRVVERDVLGNVHFNGAFRNANDLRAALELLRDQGYRTEVESDWDQVLGTFEEIFDHRSYTGRSGTFFGYEGLGSIYWHMVSKLLLAVKETYFRALESAENQSQLQRLETFYYDIRDGIGVEKNPKDYGAFPIDPYSHTPGTAGAQQPGMTGQVKEDIIARWGEFGVRIKEGSIRFVPELLRTSEFLQEPAEFQYIELDGTLSSLLLGENALAFTYCQVPIVYRLSDSPSITTTTRGGLRTTTAGLALNETTSREVFERTGGFRLIEVALPSHRIS